MTQFPPSIPLLRWISIRSAQLIVQDLVPTTAAGKWHKIAKSQPGVRSTIVVRVFRMTDFVSIPFVVSKFNVRGLSELKHGAGLKR